jgi:hypothetical protein
MFLGTLARLVWKNEISYAFIDYQTHINKRRIL